jgi:hypothetical protein
MFILSWKPGALAAWPGPYLVSATRFTYRRLVHMPGVFWNGMALRAMWPAFAGGVGVSLRGDLRTRSTYTVSVWRSPEDLRAFVGHPKHLSLMKRYGSRLESSASVTWTTDRIELRELWSLAKQKVAGIPSDG